MTNQVDFEIGDRVQALIGEEIFDELLVHEIFPEKNMIITESLQRTPGLKVRFSFLLDRHLNQDYSFDSMMEGWRALFPDPMTDELCYSQRAPVFEIKLAT